MTSFFRCFIFALLCSSALAVSSGTVTVSPTSIDATTTVLTPQIVFTDADFGCTGGFDLTDVNIAVSFDKTAGTCSSPLTGSSFHSELSFLVTSSAGASVNLVSTGDYSGSANITPGVTVTFDQAAGSAITGTPATGTFTPVSDSMDAFNQAVPGGSVAFELTGGDSLGSDPLCVFSWEVVATASCITGGGGDPHIFTPNLPTHADLFEFVKAISGRSGEEHMDVTIISSSTVTVTGHISNKPATEKHYFTAFTVATATESIRIGFESLGGIAQASLSSNNAEQQTCASESSSRRMENDSVVVSMDCSEGVQERAYSNAVVAAHFQSHAPFARTAFTVETEDFELELFFVQKDQASPGFGFFDFSVAPLPGAQELGGLFTNSPIKPEADRAVGSRGSATTAFILANARFA